MGARSHRSPSVESDTGGEEQGTLPFRPDSKVTRYPSSVFGEGSSCRGSHLNILQEIESEIQRAGHKRAAAESRKRQAMLMLEEAEAMEREAAEERRSACNKRVGMLERLRAQAIENSWGGGDSSPQPLPRSGAQNHPLPPIIIDRTDDDLETLTTRSRQASSAISPTNRSRRSSSSAGSVQTTFSNRSSKKAKLRGGGSDYDVLELHRRARPRTIWGGPAWA